MNITVKTAFPELIYFAYEEITIALSRRLLTLLAYTSHIKHTGGFKQNLCNFWKICSISKPFNQIERNNSAKVIMKVLLFGKLHTTESLDILCFIKFIDLSQSE